MNFAEYALMKYNKVNDYFNEATPIDIEKGVNAIKLKIKYNVAVDNKLYDRLSTKLYNVLDKTLHKMYSCIDNTFYKHFPNDVPDDELLILINQFNHYISGSMQPIFTKDFEKQQSCSGLSKKISKKINAKPVRTLSISNDLYLEVLNNLLDSTSNLSNLDYRMAETIIKHKIDVKDLPKKVIDNRTLAIHLIYALLQKRKSFKVEQFYPYIKTVNDVIKYYDICTKHRYSSSKECYLYQPECIGLSSYDYNNIFKLLSAVLEKQKLKNAFSDMKTNENTIKRLLYYSNGYLNKDNKKIHQTIKHLIYDVKLQSVNSIVNDMIENSEYNELAKHYPSYFVRNYVKISERYDYNDDLITQESFNSLLSLPTRLIIQLFNRVNRNADIPNVYNTAHGFVLSDKKPKAVKNTKLVRQLLSEKIVEPVLNGTESIPLDTLMLEDQENENLEINYAIPSSSRDISSISSIPFSKFKLPDSNYINVYTKWKADTDIDLSAKFIRDENDDEDCAYYEPVLGNPAFAKHSGDITHNPNTNHYVSEKILINKKEALEQGYKYAFINLFSYRGLPLDKADVHIGIQDINNPNDINDNIEETYFDTIPDTDRTHFSFLLLNLEENTAIIVNTPTNTIKLYENAINGEYTKLAEFIDSIASTTLSLNNIIDYLPISFKEDFVITKTLELIKSNPKYAKVFLDKFK